MRLKNKLFLGLLALFLAGCFEHEWVDTASDKPVKVTAQIAKGRVGFSEMDSITYAYWENDDAITLSTASQGNLDYVASTSAEGATTVTFNPESEYLKDIDGEDVLACYPASAITDGVVSLPITSVWTDDQPMPFAYAESNIENSEVRLRFKHIFAFLKLTVTPDMLSDTTKAIRYVTVGTTSGVPLSTGEGSTFDFSTKDVNLANGETSVTINTNTRVVNSKWDVYIPVLPQPAGAEMNIALISEVGDTLYTMTKKTPVTGFLEGNVYRMGTNVSYNTSYLIDGPTFNASIKELVNGSAVGRGVNDEDSLIAKVEFLTEVPALPEKYITVSAVYSPAPIYATFNPADSLLTVFTPAKDIEVVDASFMFNKLKSMHTVEFGNFNINETTTNISAMFQMCSSLISLDVSGWDTSNVTDMSHMFFHCYVLTILDVSNWNTGNVTEMDVMFSCCSALATLDVSDWDTSNVTDMSSVFYGCSGLTSLDVSSWDTSNVTTTYAMFYDCFALTTLDVSNWDTSNVTDMGYMFRKCFTLTTLDVSNWDISKVTSICEMFYECFSLTTLDVSNWDTSNVTDMGWTFFYCEALKELNVTNWNTEKVWRMFSLFNTCSSLTDLDVSNWNTENVTEMCWMFRNLSLITNLDVSNWETRKVTNMRQMFCGSSALTGLDISNWNTENVTNMHQMFFSCSSLTTLEVPDWNTSNVTDMGWMFGYCSSLTDLNMSNWNTENAIEMDSLFHYCPSLTSLDISNWTFADNKDINVMFANCASTSQACKITATSEVKDFLLARTGTTGMNPEWFIWGDAENGGSSFDDIPKQEWKTVIKSRTPFYKVEKIKEMDRPERAGSRGAAPDGGRLSGDNPRHHRHSSLYDGDYRNPRY